MRDIPSTLATHLEQRRLFIATLYQVTFPYTTKAGALVIGFTNHDQPLTRTVNAVSTTYSPEFIVKDASINQKLNSAIDDTELELKIDDDTVNYFDIRTRAWHNALVRVARTKWNGADESYIVGVFLVSNATINKGRLKLELRGVEREWEVKNTPRLTANCQHTFAGARCGYNLDPDAWAAATAYALSVEKDHKAKVIVKPTVANGFWYETTVAGTSHATTEPTWPVVPGDTVVDNTVTWQAIYAGSLVGEVTAVAGKTNFSASGIAVVDDWFAKGRVLWLTGDNATQRMKVYSDDGAGVIVLEEDCYNTISIGDTFRIDAGCRKRIDTDCTTKFDNTWNAWAWLHLVSEKAVAKSPSG